MTEINKRNIKIDEKLASLRFICDNNSHIVVDLKQCNTCKEKCCLFVCPADVYKEENGSITVEYENCLECGTCKVCCPKGAINWNYPKNASGVKYRFG